MILLMLAVRVVIHALPYMLSGAELQDTIERSVQHCDVSAANRLRANNTGLLGQQSGGQTDGAMSSSHTASK